VLTHSKYDSHLSCCMNKARPGNDSYSGIHDHGTLPLLREGGYGAILVGCIYSAKKFNDDYITGIMMAHQASKRDRHETQLIKKAKREKASV
jgi:hypothetical protein